jgi:hypothetical protein
MSNLSLEASIYQDLGFCKKNLRERERERENLCSQKGEKTRNELEKLGLVTSIEAYPDKQVGYPGTRVHGAALR